MVVIAVVAALAAIAVPAYKDYVTKAKVQSLVQLAKHLVDQEVEYYNNHGQFALAGDIYPVVPGFPGLVDGASVANVPHLHSAWLAGRVCPNGKHHGEVMVVSSPTLLGENTTIALVYDVIDDNGVLKISCGYDPDWNSTTVLEYLPADCQSTTRSALAVQVCS